MNNIRGQDNWTTPYEYITQQLLIYNYDNPVHQDILKRKLWVLDGELLNEEEVQGIHDDDYNNPKNHFAVLKNELYLLDLYVRTQNGQLQPHEKTFDEEIARRQRFYDRVEQGKIKDPATGQPLQTYQIPYSQRPSYMTETEFQNLYNIINPRIQSGEFSSAKDLIDKVVDNCNDFFTRNVEKQIENYVAPAVVKQRLRERAYELKYKYDDVYVERLNLYRQEIIDNYMKYEKFQDYIQDCSADPTITCPDNPLYVLHFPQLRVFVTEEQDQDGNYVTHKGVYNELQTFEVDPNDDSKLIKQRGGYWYKVHGLYNNDTFKYEEWMTTQVVIGEIAQPMAYPFTGTEEQFGFDIVLITQYHDSIYRHADFLGIIFFFSRDIATIYPSVPDSEETPNAGTVERFWELNTRWKYINDMREHKFKQFYVGLRIEIESCFSAEIPNLLPDYYYYFEARKGLKWSVTRGLREELSEFN